MDMSKSDSCSGNYVVEAYCKPDNSSAVTSYDCRIKGKTWSCQGGACVSSGAPSLNPFTKLWEWIEDLFS
jgi:hypothetical protein